MWLRATISTGLLVTSVAFASVHVSARASATRPQPGCAARAPRAFVTNFLAAFNRGDLRRIDRLVAPRRLFRHYTISAGPGERVGADARSRSTLIEYLAARRGHSEQFLLTWFAVSRRLPGSASFRFDLVRSADDFAPERLYRGSGMISCVGRRRLVTWAIGPNTERLVPAPQSYAETCRLMSAWCEIQQSAGSIPEALRRPLAFPSVPPGTPCPTTSGRYFDSGQFGGFALGEGPVHPLVGFAGARELAPQGILSFHSAGSRGWYDVKTLWFAHPEYRGPVLIRGRQLDGPHSVFLGESPRLVDPQMGPGDTLNGREGWREWPGGTYLRTPGCYAWQVDGTDFSHVIVFRAVFA
jgi:hypothetical protein